MKKYLWAPLAIIMVFAMLFACSCGRYENGRLVVDEEGEGPVGAVYVPVETEEEEETQPVQQEETTNDVVIQVDVVTEDNLATMLPIMSKIMEYQSTNNYSLDFANIANAEEFWNLMAIVFTYSEDGQQYLDSDNVFHIKKAVLTEYAKTFFPQYYEQKGIPSYKNCYSVSYDPGPATYDINYLTLNNKKITLVSISPSTGEQIGDYVVELLVEDAEEDKDEYQGPVTQYMYICNWSDGGEHTFPYQLVY